MALALTFIHGFEQADVNSGFYTSTENTPIADAAVTRGGSYSLKCLQSVDRNRVSIRTTSLHENAPTPGSTTYIIGVAVRFSDATPTNDIDFLERRPPGFTDDSCIGLRLKSNGDIAIVDANQTEVGSAAGGMVDNTWHYIELYSEEGASAAAEVFIDNVSIVSVTAKDFLHASGASEVWNFNGGPASSADIWFDDVYCLTGATAASERLSTSDQGMEVLDYQTLHSTSTDLGDTLDHNTWTVTAIRPSWTVSDARYTGTPRSGGTIFDASPTLSGPNGDSRVSGDIEGIAFIGAFDRGGGSATTHEFRVGNDGDGFTNFSFNPSNSPNHFSLMYDTAATGVIPTKTEYIEMGMAVTGARDLNCFLLIGELLHRPAVGGAPPSNYYAQII